jgi:hypothetical protein
MCKFDTLIGVLKFPIVEQFNELSELPLVTCQKRTVSRPVPYGALTAALKVQFQNDSV